MIEEKYLLLFANLKRKQLLNKVVVNPLPIFFWCYLPVLFHLPRNGKVNVLFL